MSVLTYCRHLKILLFFRHLHPSIVSTRKLLAKSEQDLLDRLVKEITGKGFLTLPLCTKFKRTI